MEPQEIQILEFSHKTLKKLLLIFYEKQRKMDSRDKMKISTQNVNLHRKNQIHILEQEKKMPEAKLSAVKCNSQTHCLKQDTRRAL